MTSAFPLPPAAARPPRPPFPSGSHLAFPRAPATGISPSQGGPGEAGEVGDGWGAHRCLSSLPQESPHSPLSLALHTLPQARLLRVRVPGYGSKWLLEGAGTGQTFWGSHPIPRRQARVRSPSGVVAPAIAPVPLLSTSPLSSHFLDQSPPGEAKGGVCAMGRGLGNGSPALGGAAGGFLADPGPGRRTVQLPSHTPPRQPHYIPVHCRTGQSFAHKNRATQPPRHTSGEKMAARARRKLPKVPERTGQRAAAAAAERAERAGARLREASGGARGRGGVGAAAVASSAPPRAWGPPPSALRPLGPGLQLWSAAAWLPFARWSEKSVMSFLGGVGGTPLKPPHPLPCTSGEWSRDRRTVPRQPPV